MRGHSATPHTVFVTITRHTRDYTHLTRVTSERAVLPVWPRVIDLVREQVSECRVV
jgi:hypothetical protein